MFDLFLFNFVLFYSNPINFLLDLVWILFHFFEITSNFMYCSLISINFLLISLDFINVTKSYLNIPDSVWFYSIITVFFSIQFIFFEFDLISLNVFRFFFQPLGILMIFSYYYLVIFILQLELIVGWSLRNYTKIEKKEYLVM